MSTSEELLQMITIHSRPEYRYTILNLMGQDLSNLLFEDLELSNILFRGCNLAGATFRNCEFWNTDFAGCIVDEKTLFTGCFMNGWTSMSLCHNANARAELVPNAFDSDLYHAITFKLPLKKTREFTGYKVAVTKNNTLVLVTLKIPADARTVVFKGQKCRASKVKVSGFAKLDGTPLPDDTVAYSWVYTRTKSVYAKDRMVIADSFDDRPSEECTNGIHFFLTKKEAIEFANETIV